MLKLVTLFTQSQTGWTYYNQCCLLSDVNAQDHDVVQHGQQLVENLTISEQRVPYLVSNKITDHFWASAALTVS